LGREFEESGGAYARNDIIGRLGGVLKNGNVFPNPIVQGEVFWVMDQFAAPLPLNDVLALVCL